MTSDPGFTCSCSKAHHPELPMNHTARVREMATAVFHSRGSEQR
ncbi:hypothetical protein ABZ070_00885 [Streptomyces sp. NPDC006283]